MKITITEAAEFLECTESRIQELLREGRLPGLKMGKSWVIPTAMFYEYVEGIARYDSAVLFRPSQPSQEVIAGQAKAYAIGRPRMARSV